MAIKRLFFSFLLSFFLSVFLPFVMRERDLLRANAIVVISDIDEKHLLLEV